MRNIYFILTICKIISQYLISIYIVSHKVCTYTYTVFTAFSKKLVITASYIFIPKTIKMKNLKLIEHSH